MPFNFQRRICSSTYNLRFDVQFFHFHIHIRLSFSNQYALHYCNQILNTSPSSHTYLPIQQYHHLETKVASTGCCCVASVAGLFTCATQTPASRTRTPILYTFQNISIRQNPQTCLPNPAQTNTPSSTSNAKSCLVCKSLANLCTGWVLVASAWSTKQ